MTLVTLKNTSARISSYRCMLTICTGLATAAISGCGGGFASGPTASETPGRNTGEIAASDNAPSNDTAIVAVAQVTPRFSPESGTVLSQAENSISITGIADAETVCLSTNGTAPILENGICSGTNVQQLDNPPNDLSVPVSCDSSDTGATQSHTVQLVFSDAQGLQYSAQANYVQTCNGTATPMPIAGITGAIALEKASFSTLEDIPVSYSVSFSEQFVNSGEQIGLFPDGGLNTTCDSSVQPIASLSIIGPVGQVIFPPQAEGQYQLQMLDYASCHLGAPLRLTVVPPAVTVYQLQEGEDGYEGSQDTSIAQAGVRKDTPLGDEKEIEADGVDLGDGELVILLQWALPPEITGMVTNASITLEITNTSVGTYGIYAMNAAWNQDTAVWDSVNLAVNQGQILLGTIQATARGDTSFALNENGVALTQAWIDGLVANNGVIIRAINTDDGIMINTNEERRKNKRPLLQLSVIQ